ncbi:MAG: response regulator [Chthoniobacterales bacterium]|nr:response regulator [Chthoniobacterales bacterium]
MQAFSNSLVLVVDDTPENITTVSMLLQDICEVAAATNGQEALDLAAATSPDLILLDVLMPEMDGFATCRKLKENPETASIPVIFVTTLDSPEDKLEGFAVGAVDYITKPFHAGEIRARVRTQLRIRKLEQHILQYQQFVAGEKKEFDSGSKFSEKFNQIFVCAEADDAVNFLNTAWVNLTQRPISAALGRLFPDLLHPEEREPVARTLLNAKKHKLAETHFDIRLPVPGGYRWMRMNVSFFYNDSGQCEGWNAFLTDISDLVDRLDIQKKALDTTRIANASRIEALQDAAQTLREPLFGLSTSLASLKSLTLPSDAYPPLTAASSRLHELHQRLANLLELFSNQTFTGEKKAVVFEKQQLPTLHRSFDTSVLVADDSAVNLRILVHLLRKLGFHDITSASNGQEAKELYRLRHHELIILDQQMPIMDGFTAAREILALRADHSPVLIALTASVQDSVVEEARRSGFHSFLPKPVTLSILREQLNKLGWQS